VSGPARYAVYFAPAAETPLWRFGSAWLGRDALTDETLARPPLPEPAADDWDAAALDALTESPAGYGFHATLKPPFRLAEGETKQAFEVEAEAFAAAQAPFDCEGLAVAELGRFIAFRVAPNQPLLQMLASNAVRAFDRFRAPAGEAEMAKRRKAGLSEVEEAMLQRWGYPYVFDAFRFHMTLTGPIADAGARARLAKALQAMAAEAGVGETLAVDGIALYEQPGAGAPFRLFRRLPFGG